MPEKDEYEVGGEKRWVCTCGASNTHRSMTCGQCRKKR